MTDPRAFTSLVITWALSIALASGARAADPALPLQYAVVVKADSVQRMHDHRNLYPWDVAEPGTIIVSNACGFAKVKYRRVVSAATTEHWTAYALLGEWCETAEFKPLAPTLIAYRDWQGKSYVWSVAEIHTDDTGRRYIDDNLFIDSTGLEAVIHGDDRVTGPQDEERVYLDELGIKP